MFTGLVEATGTVASLSVDSISVRCGLELEIGGSIAVNGVCLTVAKITDGHFRADISQETAALTTLPSLSPGTAVNLERPLRADGRLGGHIVQGHVDAVGVLASRIDDEAGGRFRFELGPASMRYVVLKGSIAVDGVSLTVASLDGKGFEVALIPHTLASTNLGDMETGRSVNIETDILARYVERLMDRTSTSNEGDI